MGARFAGSQRLGDRRRRRLAVETDDGSGEGAQRRPLSAPLANSRSLESGHTVGSTDAGTPSFDRAIGCIVPRQWWKYLAGGLASLAIAGGLVVAGVQASRSATVLGPGIERLFGFPGAPVVTWFSSLLLTVSAQLALLIWWARSQSGKDFDGRYWLWIRMACVWLLFSGCVATGAAAALTSTLKYLWPVMSDQTATLLWLVPVSAAGIASLTSLVREMRGCRWSRACLILGALAYAAAAGLHLELESLVTPATRGLVLHASFLAGHVAVFLSTWLHARHVMYCTVDPEVAAPARWRIPRPHFRLPRLGRNRSQATQRRAADPPAAGRERPERAPATEARRVSASEGRAEVAPVHDQTAPLRQPRVRIDVAQEHRAPTAEAAPSMPRTPGSAKGAPAEITGGNHANLRPRESLPDPASASASAATNDSGGESFDEPEESGSGPVDPGETLSKPDLRGLSKKQRRRLMQELRERERSGGR